MTSWKLRWRLRSGLRPDHHFGEGEADLVHLPLCLPGCARVGVESRMSTKTFCFRNLGRRRNRLSANHVSQRKRGTVIRRSTRRRRLRSFLPGEIANTSPVWCIACMIKLFTKSPIVSSSIFWRLIWWTCSTSRNEMAAGTVPSPHDDIDFSELSETQWVEVLRSSVGPTRFSFRRAGTSVYVGRLQSSHLVQPGAKNPRIWPSSTRSLAGWPF